MLRRPAKPHGLLHHRVVPLSCQSSSLPRTPGRVSPLALLRRLRCLLQHQRESRRVKRTSRRVGHLQAGKEIGLEVPKTPPANPLRLDDWFLGRSPAAPPRSPPVPFFPEVHEELVRTWRAPYSSRPQPSSSPLATLDGGAARGYVAIPQVERAVAVHLCPRGTATWRDRPHLPSRACKLSFALAGRAYHAAGQAATALHALATLQVYQAQALKHLHEGGPDQGAMQELHAGRRSRGPGATPMADPGPDGRRRQSPLSRRSRLPGSRRATTSAGPQPPPARHRGRPPAAPKTPAPSPAEAHDARLAARRRAGRGRAAPPAVPDTGNPEVEEIALWGTTTPTSPLPVEGRELLCAQMLPVPFLSDALPPRIRTRREEGKRSPVQSVNAPLIPLATRLGAWLQLPSPSRWLIRTVRLGYAIQFARRPPRYGGVLSTTVHSDTHATVLRAEVAVLLAKDAIEPVPPAEMKSGFYSPYFIVPKKSGGLRPILDLRALNWSLLRLPFKMLTTKRMLTCIRRQDWFAAIDLKDAYFHVSILPRHRFAFEGRAYQYKVLPFGLSLSPRVFIKVMEAALDLVLRHLSHLGLQVNREKSKLSPVQRISFLGVELDSVNMTARLTNEYAHAVLNCLNSFRHRTAVPLKTFQRLLGHMAAAAAVMALGLLHMSPLQHWLHDRVPRWAWHRGTLRIGVSPQCRRRLFSPPEHLVVHTDASSTGWGAVCNGQAASGSWTGPRLQWHINCLELLAVLLAL
ncbi:hypothetical protein M9458_007906, partial [Cirrhinus mrigala]